MPEKENTNPVFIALGTNLGDRLANLNEAMRRLQPAAHIRACSPVYETPPWGYADQPSYLNQVIQAETSLDPMALFAALKRIELDMGRVKIIENGPRLIDLDLLFYADRIVESERLTLPHPRMAGRGFVLLPLADLAPTLIHPITGQTVIAMLAQADCTGIARFADGICPDHQ